MPRHKTIQQLHTDTLRRERQTKQVRIDAKTTIFVSVNIPDDEARENFLLKREENERSHSTKYDRSRNAIQKTEP